MNKLISILFLMSGLTVALQSPWQIESKVREDLEALIGTVIIKEQFLVQVAAEVTTESKRQLIEGETTQDELAVVKEDAPEPLPGFVPIIESAPEAAKPAKTIRERFANVEVQKLGALRVNVNIDETLPTPAFRNAEKLVRNYITENYPEVGRVTINKLPILKPERDPATEEKKEPVPEPAKPPTADEPKIPSFEENLLKWLPWAALGLLIILLFISVRSSKQAQPAQQQAAPFPWPMYPPQKNENTGVTTASSGLSASPNENTQVRLMRTRLFSKSISHAQAFSHYYQKLDMDQQQEIEVALAGPAFDAFMDGLEILRAPKDATINDLEERISWHESQFDEFVQADQWRQKQFFGFLSNLSNEQLLSLVGFESDSDVCLMLRFLKPAQSAFVLDHLAPMRRNSVLANMARVQNMPLSDIASIEKKTRDVVNRMPQHMTGTGQDANFWGNVLDHSANSMNLLKDIEVTNPGISPQLQKYRFSLDDAASLPDEYLSKVISEADNEELCLALTTCPERTVDLILDALPEKRRNLVKQLMVSYRSASPEKAQQARTMLTKRIREAMKNAA